MRLIALQCLSSFRHFHLPNLVFEHPSPSTTHLLSRLRTTRLRLVSFRMDIVRLSSRILIIVRQTRCHSINRSLRIAQSSNQGLRVTPPFSRSLRFKCRCQIYHRSVSFHLDNEPRPVPVRLKCRLILWLVKRHIHPFCKAMLLCPIGPLIIDVEHIFCFSGRNLRHKRKYLSLWIFLVHRRRRRLNLNFRRQKTKRQRKI